MRTDDFPQATHLTFVVELMGKGQGQCTAWRHFDNQQLCYRKPWGEIFVPGFSVTWGQVPICTDDWHEGAREQHDANIEERNIEFIKSLEQDILHGRRPPFWGYLPLAMVASPPPCLHCGLIGILSVEVQLTGDAPGACTIWAGTCRGVGLICRAIPWHEIFRPVFHVEFPGGACSSQWY